MTLQQLQYIVALAKYKNFVEAAKNCYVTQPTLSMQIQKLEDYLQVKIFDRTKWPVIPTPIGEKIIEKARHILQETGRIEEVVLEAKGLIQGDFRLGIIPSVAGSLVPRFLREFTQKYPKVNLIIDEVQTDHLIEKLCKEEVDAGIAATPLENSRVIEKPIYYESFYIYVPDKHPYLKKKSVEQSELQEENILLMSDGHCFRQQALQVCGFHKVKSKNNITFESSNFQTLIQLVEQGMGITLLPHFVTDLVISKKQRARIIPFKGKKPSREIGLVFTRGVYKEAILNAVYETIFDLIPDDMKSVNKKQNIVISPN